jgi:hypothetical protein
MVQRVCDPKGSAQHGQNFRKSVRQNFRKTRRQSFRNPHGREVRYKYSGSNSGQYKEIAERAADGEELLVATVQEREHVIGYGIAAVNHTNTEIEIIDVDEFSRRSTGLQRTLLIAGAEFGVGVGHVVVDLLVAALNHPVLVDATSSESRYIFKSLGFTTRPGEQNPCLLHLPVGVVVTEHLD